MLVVWIRSDSRGVGISFGSDLISGPSGCVPFQPFFIKGSCIYLAPFSFRFDH